MELRAIVAVVGLIELLLCSGCLGERLTQELHSSDVAVRDAAFSGVRTVGSDLYSGLPEDLEYRMFLILEGRALYETMYKGGGRGYAKLDVEYPPEVVKLAVDELYNNNEWRGTLMSRFHTNLWDEFTEVSKKAIKERFDNEIGWRSGWNMYKGGEKFSTWLLTTKQSTKEPNITSCGGEVKLVDCINDYKYLENVCRNGITPLARVVAANKLRQEPTGVYRKLIDETCKQILSSQKNNSKVSIHGFYVGMPEDDANLLYYAVGNTNVVLSFDTYREHVLRKVTLPVDYFDYVGHLDTVPAIKEILSRNLLDKPDVVNAIDDGAISLTKNKTRVRFVLSGQKLASVEMRAATKWELPEYANMSEVEKKQELMRDKFMTLEEKRALLLDKLKKMRNQAMGLSHEEQAVIERAQIERAQKIKEDAKNSCVYCGSTSYGRCLESPSGKHKHASGGGKCIWCGSTSYGRCLESPNGKHEH